MNKKLVQGIVIGVVVLVAVLGWALHRPSNNANFPEGTDWLCLNPKCGTAFNLSMKQLGEYSAAHRGEPIKCPKCGTPAIRAEKCQHCGKYFPERDSHGRCPFCGKVNQPPPETASLELLHPYPSALRVKGPAFLPTSVGPAVPAVVALSRTRRVTLPARL
jgi:hypothetical protein